MEFNITDATTDNFDIVCDNVNECSTNSLRGDNNTDSTDANTLLCVNVNESNDNIFDEDGCLLSTITLVTPNDELSKIIAFRNLTLSWGISQKTVSFLSDTHECTIKTLEVMDLDSIDELFENYPKGEKIIFKAGLRKWRDETNNPLTASDATRSLNSKVLKWMNEQSSLPSPVPGVSMLHDNRQDCVRESYDILQILKTTIKGQLAINYYDKNKCLDNKHRQYMVHTIIDHFMGKNHKLTGSDFKTLSQNISDIFITEYSPDYYVPRQGKKKPSGKLYDRYSNACFGTKFLKLKRTSTSTIERFSATSTPDSFSTEDFLKNKQWLKYNFEPWDLVCDKWRETSRDRIASFKLSSNKNITQFVEEWPLYKHYLGYQLIDIDFDIEYPTKFNKLLEKFDDFTNTCQSKIFLQEIKDKNNQLLFQQLIEREDLDENIRDIIVCFLLHSIIQPKRISQKLKPTISDAQEDFVVFITNLNELNSKLEEIKKKIGTLQPKIVVVGRKWEIIEDIFIVYEDIKYKCGSFRKCLNTLIKLSFIFNIEYSVISKDVWYFLQEYFFEIDSNQTRTKKFVQLFKSN